MKKNILIFPDNSENALELADALRYSVHFSVLGASNLGGHPWSAYSTRITGLPHMHEPLFMDAFTACLRANAIDLVFPTHDTVMLLLAAHRSRLPAVIVGAPERTARICREKNRMYAHFAGEPFCPRLYRPGEEPVFPVFCKPDQGEGGKNACAVYSPEELHAVLPGIPNPIVQELLPGEEYTVDCFTDRYGALRFIGPRTRELIRMGIAFTSRSVPLTEDVEAIAVAINRTLEFRGLWFFQIKRDAGGTWKLLEVCCRAATTMGVYRQRGVNLPLLTALDALDMDIAIQDNGFDVLLNRRLASGYRLGITYSTVYLDYDDTLTGPEGVNLLCVRFVYQCVNRGIRLVLLTRHEGDLAQDMRAKRLAADLFDAVHVLGPGEEKADHITTRDAIFIDNHFPERKKVHEKHGIPVFDVDAVESLLA